MSLPRDVAEQPPSGTTGWTPARARALTHGVARRLVSVFAASSVALALLAPPSTAATSHLIKDIHPGPAGSFPSTGRLLPVNVNGTLFFFANDGSHGYALWTSDGTATGTQLVKQMSGALEDHNLNGRLFFSASDGVHGFELWKSDGTAAGTVMVKDINPTGDSEPLELTTYKGELFFSASDGTHGTELWKSDGTAAGTVMVKDINPSGDSNPSELLVVNGTLFFMADDGTHGLELWKSDGSSAGTTMVKDINPSGDSIPAPLTDVNGTLYFGANDGTHGEQLWKSNGSDLGTSMVTDVNSGGSGLTITEAVALNGDLFFAADDGTHGIEPWQSNGTAPGTALVKDINPGSSSSRPFYGYVLTAVNGKVFFAANDGTHGTEFWRSDGSPAGTTMVKDINPGPSDANPTDFTNFGGTLAFQAIDPAHGNELWTSDGSTAGTRLFSDIHAGHADSNPGFQTNVNGTDFFYANDGKHGNELWGASINPPLPSCRAVDHPTAQITHTSIYAGREGVLVKGKSTDQGPQRCRGLSKTLVSVAQLLTVGGQKRCRFLKSTTEASEVHEHSYTNARSCNKPVRLPATGAGHWSSPFLVDVLPGAYQATAIAIDKAGNRSKSAKRSFTVP